jgi:4a-hydroxytetrahydrobiopterin dehydratase
MTHTALSQKKCVPCQGSTLPLKETAEKLLEQIPQWKLSDDRTRISKLFSFPAFMDAIAFVTTIAAVAEKENHHPDIKISYRKVTVTLTTHAIHGLSENDFIMAAKIDTLFSK